MTTLLEQPAKEEDRLIRSIQEHEYPEGAPPEPDTRRRWAVIGFACLMALALVTVGALFFIDGVAAVIAGVAMLLAYSVFGGAAALLGVMERARVRHKIEDRLHPED